MLDFSPPARTLTFTALLIAACCTSLAHATQPNTPKRPNIVILVGDDWGFTDIGAYGSEIATPHLDQLAKKGVKFSNFHVSASCSPTRAMLLTGVDNHRNGVGNMRETIPQAHVGTQGYLTVLNKNVVTFANLFQDHGYRTYAIGKWHVGKEPYNLPNRRGFDRSLIQGDSGSDNWKTAQRYLDISDKVYWYKDGKPARMPENYYSSTYFVDQAIDFMSQDSRQDKPFLTYIGFQAVHIPVQAPPEYIQKYKGHYQQGWDVLRQQRAQAAIEKGVMPPSTQLTSMSTTRPWASLSPQDQTYETKRMEVYAAMAEAMDANIGRFIDYLKRTKQYDNTVFVFLSDNGAEASDPFSSRLGELWVRMNYHVDLETLGEVGSFNYIGPSWASAAVSPLKTYKFYAGEGGLRVPLIISGIHGVATNSIYKGFAHVKDIAPTLLELAGIQNHQGFYQGKTIEPITGKSMLSALTHQHLNIHDANEVIGYELSGNKAVFKGDYKLVYNLSPAGDGQWHLYNIVDDPGETHDLQASHPELFQRLKVDYDRYARDNGVLEMPANYEPVNQVITNALVNVYLPRLLNYGPISLVVLGLLTNWWWRRKHRNRLAKKTT